MQEGQGIAYKSEGEVASFCCVSPGESMAMSCSGSWWIVLAVLQDKKPVAFSILDPMPPVCHGYVEKLSRELYGGNCCIY